LLLSGDNSDLKDEGYDLDIKPTGITIKANKPAGIFNGIQTLLQLLPNEISKNEKQDVPWVIGAATFMIIHLMDSAAHAGCEQTFFHGRRGQEIYRSHLFL
jgi:hypothetical protein